MATKRVTPPVNSPNGKASPIQILPLPPFMPVQPGGSDQLEPVRTSTIPISVRPVVKSNGLTSQSSNSSQPTEPIVSASSNRRIIFSPVISSSHVSSLVQTSGETKGGRTTDCPSSHVVTATPSKVEPMGFDMDTSKLEVIEPASVKVSLPSVKSIQGAHVVDDYLRRYFQVGVEVKKLKSIIIQWHQNLYTYRVPGVKERITIMITRLAQLYTLWKRNQILESGIEYSVNNTISAILDNLLGLIRVATNQNVGNEVRLTWLNQAYQLLSNFVDSINTDNKKETGLIKHMAYLSTLNSEITNINSLSERIKIGGDIPTVSYIIEMYFSLVKIVQDFYPFYLHLTDLIYHVACHNCPTIGIPTQTTTNHCRMICSYTLTDRCQNRPGMCPYAHEYKQIVFEGNDPIFTWSSNNTQPSLSSSIIDRLAAMPSTPMLVRSVCHHWAANGTCMLGAACKFDHPS